MSTPILAPQTTWYTQGGTTIDRKTITEITFVDSYTPTETVEESWDASEVKDGSVMVYREGTKLTIAGNGTGKIYANVDCYQMFFNFQSLEQINGISLLDTSKVTNMESMFENCYLLNSFDFSNFDTLSVTNMRGMFCACKAVASFGLSSFNTSNVLNMSWMFQDCCSLETLDLCNFDTSNVMDMEGMFSGCTVLTIFNISSFNTSNVTNMGYMFENCRALTDIDVSNFDTSNVTTMKRMFYYCMSLPDIDASSFDTSNVTSMYMMFQGCRSLVALNISNFNTSNVTSNGFMLDNMPCLKKITLGENFSFMDDYYAYLDAPSSSYIEGADGKWYTEAGESYAPKDIPSNRANTYYASPLLVANFGVVVKVGTLANIAKSIRLNTGSDIKYKPREMASGVDECFKKGKQTEYDTFWKACQRSGNRTNYNYGFAGYGWNSNTFYPKYDIAPKDSAAYMFYYFSQSGDVLDMVERLSECNVNMNFSQCTNFSNAFAYARISHLGEIDTTGASSLSSIFKNYTNVKTIDKLILKSKGGQTFSDAFYNTKNLESITVEGVISNSINFQYCTKLTESSIRSICNALSTTATGMTITFSRTAIDNAGFYEPNKDASDSLFGDLMTEHTNWTFNVI